MLNILVIIRFVDLFPVQNILLILHKNNIFFYFNKKYIEFDFHVFLRTPRKLKNLLRSNQVCPSSF